MNDVIISNLFESDSMQSILKNKYNLYTIIVAPKAVSESISETVFDFVNSKTTKHYAKQAVKHFAKRLIINYVKDQVRPKG